MITVDISNIWGELSLQDLLGMEQEIFAAHGALPERAAWEEPDRLQKAAGVIRAQSQVCVVLGSGKSCLGARGAMELLQGADRNLHGEGPEMVFAGNSLSTRRWNELKAVLEGKSFSLIVVSRGEMTRECAVALRGLKWILERSCGTDECRRRIFAVTDSAESTLGQMAADQGWETFLAEEASVLSPEGLLPMAAAGIDISALLAAAGRARKEFDLRSFENPVWLYTAVRKLMLRSGKFLELLAFWEPCFGVFGLWWQSLFARNPGEDLVPMTLSFPGGQPILPENGRHTFLETMLRFAPDSRQHIIGYDVCDLDGLNAFSDMTMDALEEQTYSDVLENHIDSCVPMIVLECGAPDEETLGELLIFLELARELFYGRPREEGPEPEAL